MTSVAAPPLASPFRGLAPFGDTDLDALLFFGRERETEVVVANLVASRLTVLFGPSGVGKSSLLAAGATRRLRELARARTIGAHPDAAVVVFSSWAEDPVARLSDAIGAEVAALAPEALPPPDGSTLAEVCEHWSAVLDGELYLVLDQLEEYFVYHGEEPGQGPLVAELPPLVLSPSLRVNVLLSLREDALALLDVFKEQIPNVFGNQLRLDRLDGRAARAAILGPVQRWNDLVEPAEQVTIEPALVDEVLTQAASGADPDRIEPPYLQLVMERLWNAEHEEGSRALRLATLTELGGAGAIVQHHLDRALDVLEPDAQDAAARMFAHLVTPSGTKIAHRTSDLAEFADMPRARATPVLTALGRERILRPLDSADGDRYEIFHDVLAQAILEWRRRHELEHERADARRRHRRLLAALVAALAVAAVMTGMTAYAFTQRREARTQAALAQQRRAEAIDRAVDAENAGIIALLQEQQAVKEQHAAEAAQATAEEQKREADEQKQRADDEAEKEQAAQEDAEAQAAVAATKEAEAEASATEAKLAKNDALAQKQKAESAKNDALLQKGKAERAKNDALRQKAKADRERRTAKKAEHKAEVSAAKAKKAQRLATADSLAFQALSTYATDPEATLDVALEAYKLAPDDAVVERALRLGLIATKGERILAGGGGAVNASTYDPTGRYVATASGGGARLFDAASGALLRTLVRNAPVFALGFSPDGTRVATATANGATVWDVRTGVAVTTVRHADVVRSVTFSSDGTRLLTASDDRSLAVWDAASGLRLTRIPLPAKPMLAAFSPDSSRILTLVVVTVQRRPGRIYDSVSGDLLTRVSQRSQMTDAAWSPDGETFATAGRDDVAVIWDARTGEAIHTLTGHASDVLSVAYSPDGSHVATTSLADATARVWSTRTGEVERILVAHATKVLSAAFSPDGTKIATASTDLTARLWTVAEGASVAIFAGHDDAVTTVAFSPDGMHVVTSGDDGDARIWDATGEPRMALVGRHDGRAFGAAFSGDGKRLVTAGADGTARLWDVTERKELARFRAGVPLNDAAVTADGRYVAAAGSDGVARVWRLSDGVERTLGAPGKALKSVAFSSDGKLLVTGGDDGDATVWRWPAAARARALAHPQPVLDAVFSPDGTRLATASADGEARLWRVSDGKLLRPFVGHEAAVTGVAFSGGGKRLATSSADNDSRLWDVASGKSIRTFRGHAAVVSGITLSSDGRWAATAGPSKVGLWATSGHDFASDRMYFLVGATDRLSSTAFSPSGWTIAATSYDGTVRTYTCSVCAGVSTLVPLARERLHRLGLR